MTGSKHVIWPRSNPPGEPVAQDAEKPPSGQLKGGSQFASVCRNRGNRDVCHVVVWTRLEVENGSLHEVVGLVVDAILSRPIQHRDIVSGALLT